MAANLGRGADGVEDARGLGAAELAVQHVGHDEAFEHAVLLIAQRDERLGVCLGASQPFLEETAPGESRKLAVDLDDALEIGGCQRADGTVCCACRRWC